MDDQFDVEIVIYRDEKKDDYLARLKITLDAKTIEGAIVMAVDLLDKHPCQYYTVVKVRNNSVV